MLAIVLHSITQSNRRPLLGFFYCQARSGGLPLLRGANALGTALMEQEVGSDEVAHLSQG